MVTIGDKTTIITHTQKNKSHEKYWHVEQMNPGAHFNYYGI